jgi:hypothetical protein
VFLGPATIARAAERTGEGDGSGEGEATVGGEGVTLGTEGDGVDSEMVTEQADNRRRAGTKNFITYENA